MCKRNENNVVPLQFNLLDKYSKYKSDNKTNDDVVIARYFDREKFDRFLNDSTIWFSNSEKFNDNNERKITESYFDGWDNNRADFYKKITKAKDNIFKAYISCWTKFDSENYALWKIYDPNSKGCAIVTTIGKLKEQIRNSIGEHFLCYEVEYTDGDVKNSELRPDIPSILLPYKDSQFHILAREKFKIKPYEYEKEIRFVFYSDQNCSGRSVDVKLDQFIDKIIISPFASENETQKIKEKISEKLPGVKIENSIIDEKF